MYMWCASARRHAKAKKDQFGFIFSEQGTEIYAKVVFFPAREQDALRLPLSPASLPRLRYKR